MKGFLEELTTVETVFITQITNENDRVRKWLVSANIVKET
jgi:hypothetical protein